MPNLDDELRRRMQRAGRRVDTDGVEGRLHERRARKQITQKAGRGLLAVAVLAGSAIGVAGLNRAFRGGDRPGNETPTLSGTIAYLSQVRSCEPGIDGPSTDIVALDIATGDVRVIRSTRFFTDSDRPKAERSPELSPDGTRMAWAGGIGHNLEVTDVATGGSEQLTRGLSVGAPHWSPDGTTLLFAAGERSEDPSGQTEFLEGPDAVYTMNADGSDLTKLTDGTLPIWSPDGRVAFMRLGGASLDLTDPDSVPEFGPTAFYVMNADGTDMDKVYEAPGDVPIRDAEWSPDGTRIAGEATLRGNTDIFVVDLNLRSAVRLTDHPTQDTSPTWSPDGSMIAFQTGRWMGNSSYGEVGHSEIAVMNADGSDVRRLTADCVDDYSPTWVRNDEVVRSLPVSDLSARPDLGDPHVPDPGDILLSGTVGNFSDLFALNPTTEELTNLTADYASQMSPAWSPDRTRIAFSGDVQEPGNYDIYTMKIDGSDVVRLTTDRAFEGRPSWSPDGSTLAFEGENGIWTIGTDGGDLRKVGAGPDGGGNYASWSPDGASIAFTDDGTIFVADPSGTRVDPIYEGRDASFAYEVQWSPDGSVLLFTCERDICLIGVNGEGLVNLTEAPGTDTYEREADWSPDGAQIVFLGDGRPTVMDRDGTHVRPLGDGTTYGGEPDW